MSKLLQRTQKITSKIINKMPTTGLFFNSEKKDIFVEHILRWKSYVGAMSGESCHDKTITEDTKT